MSTSSLCPPKRRGDHVARIGPLHHGIDAGVGDSHGIQKILNVGVQAPGFAVHAVDQGANAPVVAQCRDPVEHAGSTQDRRDRRSQLMGHAADQGGLEKIGLQPHIRVGESGHRVDAHEGGGRLRQNRLDAIV
jgi:hypothetical protein